MDSLIEAVVFVVRLALAGFVMWGGWLALSSWLVPAPKPKKVDDFERVASLVLLALLCTTMAGLG